MKFSGKICFKIILKVTKKQGFTLSLEDTFFEKPQGGGQIDTPPSRFRVKGLKNNGISLQMANIFNLSVVTGVFTSALKLAKVIPIYKKKSKLTCSNYRPIYLV